ncbi:MAG: hypothetical protein GY936_09225 [Ignavibacteriae bacterium]|nr:hypothetical protein [Ignavibacteriota bacterium]
MEHSCYHIISDQNTKHIPLIDDAKKMASEWKGKGDSNIRVFKITATEDEGSDRIFIDEKLIPTIEIFDN